jgi:hypothetical protein
VLVFSLIKFLTVLLVCGTTGLPAQQGEAFDTVTANPF